MTERRVSRMILWPGLALLALFALMAVVGPWIAPYSVNWSNTVKYEGVKLVRAPEAPSADHWFGKDQLGRDVLSLMLHGLRYTLGFVLAVSLLRILLGGMLGIWLGIREEDRKHPPGFFRLGIRLSGSFFRMSLGGWIRVRIGREEKNETEKETRKPSSMGTVTGWFGGIPVIFLLVLLLEGSYDTRAYWRVIIVQGVVLALLGIWPVASTISKQTRELKKRLFVIVSRVMGAGKEWIIRKHILPHLKETIIILFVQDMIVVLNILGQLSVFRIFLGGTEFRFFPEAGEQEFYSRSFEWLGLIGQNKTWMIAYSYLVWVPLAAYFALLLSFFLVAKGLELRWRGMYNKHPHV